jgi:hypothetical protein
MKKVLYFMVIVVAMIGMTLMFSTKSMAAMMPESAGTTIEKGSANNVSYETGGVGIEERAAMDQSMHNYNLRLVFATMKGWYLASIPVQIQTPEGKVLLSKESNGPWFWVKLPAGQYEVVASRGNKKEVHKVEVGKTPQSVEFTWKQPK